MVLRSPPQICSEQLLCMCVRNCCLETVLGIGEALQRRMLRRKGKLGRRRGGGGEAHRGAALVLRSPPQICSEHPETHAQTNNTNLLGSSVVLDRCLCMGAPWAGVPCAWYTGPPCAVVPCTRAPWVGVPCARWPCVGVEWTKGVLGPCASGGGTGRVTAGCGAVKGFPSAWLDLPSAWGPSNGFSYLEITSRVWEPSRDWVTLTPTQSMRHAACDLEEGIERRDATRHGVGEGGGGVTVPHPFECSSGH